MLDIVFCLPCEHDIDSLRFCLVDLFFCTKDEPGSADILLPRVWGFLSCPHTLATIQGRLSDAAHVGHLPLELSGLPEVAEEVGSS